MLDEPMFDGRPDETGPEAVSSDRGSIEPEAAGLDARAREVGAAGVAAESRASEAIDERPADPLTLSRGASSVAGTPQEASAPSPEQIAERAYALYQARGGQDGYDVEDWLAAERDLRSTRRQES